MIVGDAVFFLWNRFYVFRPYFVILFFCRWKTCNSVLTSFQIFIFIALGAISSISLITIALGTANKLSIALGHFNGIL